jgi:hypothetical protein
MVPALQPLFNTAAGFKSFKTFNGCAQFKTVPENSRSKVQTFKVQRSSPEEFKSFNMFKTFNHCVPLKTLSG